MTHVIGILGGTFDPVHFGHLRLATDVRTALDLSEVRLVPAGVPPHRTPPIASALDRLAMVELAVADCDMLKADGREVARAGLSYTIHTLEELHAEAPTHPLALLIGADAFKRLHTWHRWERIFTLAHLVVVARPGHTLVAAELDEPLKAHWERRLTTDPQRLKRQLAGAIYVQPITPQPIAATEIRTLLAKRANNSRTGKAELLRLLPQSVLAYIDRNHLYR